jgi:hypothetical protein
VSVPPGDLLYRGAEGGNPPLGGGSGWEAGTAENGRSVNQVLCRVYALPVDEDATIVPLDLFDAPRARRLSRLRRLEREQPGPGRETRSESRMRKSCTFGHTGTKSDSRGPSRRLAPRQRISFNEETAVRCDLRSM